MKTPYFSACLWHDGSLFNWLVNIPKRSVREWRCAFEGPFIANNFMRAFAFFLSIVLLALSSHPAFAQTRQEQTCVNWIMQNGLQYSKVPGQNKWSLNNARSFCSGVTDIKKRIACFLEKIKKGDHYNIAIAECKEKAISALEAFKIIETCRSDADCQGDNKCGSEFIMHDGKLRHAKVCCFTHGAPLVTVGSNKWCPALQSFDRSNPKKRQKFYCITHSMCSSGLCVGGGYLGYCVDRQHIRFPKKIERCFNDKGCSNNNCGSRIYGYGQNDEVLEVLMCCPGKSVMVGGTKYCADLNNSHATDENSCLDGSMCKSGNCVIKPNHRFGSCRRQPNDPQDKCFGDRRCPPSGWNNRLLCAGQPNCPASGYHKGTWECTKSSERVSKRIQRRDNCISWKFTSHVSCKGQSNCLRSGARKTTWLCGTTQASCNIYRPHKPKPTVRHVQPGDTCDCDYHAGGCSISKAAPAGLACQCNYKGAWTCGGKVTKCSNTNSPKCSSPDKSKAACLLGGGDCEGY